MRRSRFWSLPFWRLPVLLGLAMVALPGLLVYMNAFHRVVAGVPMYSDTALHGVLPPDVMPELTRQAVLNDSFSHAYAAYFGRTFPLLGPAVRMKGQIYWSLLHQSPTWFISIGRHDVLYENAYLDEYCSRDIAAYTPVAEAWARKLMRIQRWYAAHDKVFVYLLTPSKAATEPEFLPPGLHCPAPAADRNGFHAAYRAILDRAGVNVADAVQTTLWAKHAYPFPPFPPGGTHFNDVSAALAAQELIKVVQRVGSWPRLDAFSFNWKMSKPDPVATDLLTALNVPFTGMHYKTPMITVDRPKHKTCTTIPMAQVGGSFTYQVDKILDMTACRPTIEFYEYFHTTMALYPGDLRYPGADPARRAWQLLDASQVVVLEENEEMAARSQHGEAFYQLVAHRIEAERAQARHLLAQPVSSR